MNVTLVLDEQPLPRASLEGEARGKSFDGLIGELRQRTLAEDDQRSIDKRSSEGFERRVFRAGQFAWRHIPPRRNSRLFTSQSGSGILNELEPRKDYLLDRKRLSVRRPCSMTIGIGMLCGSGAIITADTKVTLGDHSVTHGEKLVAVKTAWGGAAIVNSTLDGHAAKTLVRKVANAMDNAKIKNWDDLEECIVPVMTKWRKAWNNPPECQLIIAANVVGMGIEIYFCEPPNTIVPYSNMGYVAIGGGSSVTDPLFQTLFSGLTVHYEVQKTCRILAYLMRRAKQGNAFCGGRTIALFVGIDGSEPRFIRLTDFEQAEKESAKLDFLLGAAAKFALLSNPGENLEHNAKGIGEMMKGLAGLRATEFHDIEGNLL